MKNKLLFLAAWLCCVSAGAQEITKTGNIDSSITHFFNPLDKSAITTDLFLDKAFQRVSSVDGTSCIINDEYSEGIKC